MVASVIKKYGEYKILGEGDVNDEIPYLILESNAVFIGEWKYGIMNGIGRMCWQDGSYYYGEWAGNKANGLGRLIHHDGDFYEGQGTDDKAEGKGKFVHY